MRFDHGEKNHLLSTCCSFEKKKNSRLCTTFPDYISIFKTFSGSGKLLGKFQEIFQELDSLYQPWFKLER